MFLFIVKEYDVLENIGGLFILLIVIVRGVVIVVVLFEIEIVNEYEL